VTTEFVVLEYGDGAWLEVGKATTVSKPEAIREATKGGSYTGPFKAVPQRSWAYTAEAVTETVTSIREVRQASRDHGSN
jgi:hypothetical protein